MNYNYTCKHCSADLDEGDIFEHFVLKYGDRTLSYEDKSSSDNPRTPTFVPNSGVLAKALYTARLYGWSETNKIHFNRSMVVQPNKGSQYTICPDCGHRDPLS